MNDDDLDSIASAYVDGEATPDEVALVERDPELQARVAQFRALGSTAGLPTAPPELKERHLAAALAAFSASAEVVPEPGTESAETPSLAATPATGPEQPSAETVIDLRAKARNRPSISGRDRGRRARPNRPGGMPSWLSAAAVFLVVGGGLVFALGRSNLANDEADFDTAAIETAEAASEPGAADNATASDAADSAFDNNTFDDSAFDDGALGGDDADADDSHLSAVEQEAAATTDSSGVRPGRDDPALPGDDESSQDRALLRLGEIPIGDRLAELDLPPLEPVEEAVCGPWPTDPEGLEPLGFVAVDVAGQVGELFVGLDSDGTEIRLLVDPDCDPVAP